MSAAQWSDVGHGLFFTRLENGDVGVVLTCGKRPDEGGELRFDLVIEAGHWASHVLNLTAFGEQPGQWHKFMDQHQGRNDVLTKDPARLDWLESRMRPADSYVEIYLAGLRSGHADATAFQVEIQDRPSVNGPTLRDAIDAAIDARREELTRKKS